MNDTYLETNAVENHYGGVMRSSASLYSPLVDTEFKLVIVTQAADVGGTITQCLRLPEHIRDAHPLDYDVQPAISVHHQ